MYIFNSPNASYKRSNQTNKMNTHPQTKAKQYMHNLDNNHFITEVTPTMM
jgi:hypothetical protein